MAPPPVAVPIAEEVEPASPPAVVGEVVALTDEERGIAGASARAEGARRSAKREDRIRSKHPKIGGLILAVYDDPTSTKVWDQGAIGEERIGRRLDDARPQIEVLHDRRLRGSRANLDHLVVAPNGIWVVDTKRYLDRRIEPRAVGRRKERQLYLFVGSRDKTNLVTAMHKQVGLVRNALAGSPFAHVPVRGMLCFIGATVGFFVRPFEVDGVLITWPKHLVRPMIEAVDEPDRVDLSEVDRTRIARHLADRFRPA